MQFAVRTLAPDMSISSIVVDAADAGEGRRQVVRGPQVVVERAEDASRPPARPRAEARGLFGSSIAPARASPFAGFGNKGGRLSIVLFSQPRAFPTRYRRTEPAAAPACR